VKEATAGAALAAERPAEKRPADHYPLAMRGVCKTWGKQAPVLEEVDLTLDLGTRTWIGGHNGVGKTTLLRIAAGLIEPDRGRTSVYGTTPSRNRARYQRSVSFLPAGDRGLYARLTVRRQLAFWARIAMVPPARMRAAVDAAVASFELAELVDRRVDRMSMGQRQRLRIAMTFLAEPEVVLLDEPLTSLDENGAAVLGRAIEQTLARDGAILWCSPSEENLGQPFEERWLLEQGRLWPA
jgi:ABC-2 type transport system ATP-binding protein